jgi:hypothetical protein
MATLTTMRFLLAVIVAVLAAFAAPTAGAQTFDRYLTAGGTLSLRDGVGSARVMAQGGVLGQLDRGRVVIRDFPDRGGTDINVWGEDWTRVIDSRATVYGGTELRFRALGGAWRVRMKGRGIDVSAAGRGAVTLSGTGGTFSLDGGFYRDWPDEATRFRYGD